MILPPFPRHSWRPLPHDGVQIPMHAHMLYGHPREGVCTHYGWRTDGLDAGNHDQFCVCLPDTVTIVPIIRSREEQRKIGPHGAENMLPVVAVKYHTNDAVGFASGPVLLDEDPRETARRLLRDQLNLVADDVVPVLVYQPHHAVDSLCYTFLMFNLKPASEIKKLEKKSGVERVSQIFTSISDGSWLGECEFFKRLIITHGHANGPGSFCANVSSSTTAYSM